ncbi:MAG: archease [Candidatus Omnitrophica bacterium]|nr:archease [Candidatus Omnitrophota bacterium]
MTDDTGYEFFEHTADVGMRASGGSLAELFAHAARGLVALVAEDSAIRPAETRAVRLRAASVEALLRAWLSELLMWFDTDRFLPAEYALGAVSATALEGEVRGERFDPARHTYGTEVKGVTRHQFRVEQRDGGWTANVIFDV